MERIYIWFMGLERLQSCDRCSERHWEIVLRAQLGNDRHLAVHIIKRVNILWRWSKEGFTSTALCACGDEAPTKTRMRSVSLQSGALLLPWKSGLGDAVPTWLTRSRCLWLELGSKWKPCPGYMVGGEDTSWHPKRKWQKTNPNILCHLPSRISRDHAHGVKVEAIMCLSKKKNNNKKRQ